MSYKSLNLNYSSNNHNIFLLPSSARAVQRLQDPQQSLLSRLASQKFSPSTYFEISIGNSEEISSRMKRAVSFPGEPFVEKDILVLSNHGFEFHVKTSRIEKRSAEPQDYSETGSSGSHTLDYVLTYDPTEEVTVDGRTAAVGEPLYPSINHAPLISHGQKLKHISANYGSSFYGGHPTTKSPFRYTSKYSSAPSIITTTIATPISEGIQTVSNDSNAESLYSSAHSKHYAYMYNKDGKKTTNSVYQLPNNEKISSTSQAVPTLSPDTHAYIPIEIPDKASLIRVKTHQREEDEKGPASSSSQQQTTPSKAPVNLSLQDSDYPDVTQNGLVDPNFHLSLNFKQTKCPKKDVVKLSCIDLQCGIRPQALSNRAR